jgi:hypothetical protein
MLFTLTRILFTLLTAVLMSSAILAADPGLDLPNDPALRFTSQISDQKKGSVLIYNLYSSDAQGGAANDTRINITNTNTGSGIAVHLFFVDGTSCSVADSYICLSPNQTASFLASDIDPGTIGYLLAIATDRDGVPTAFDYLIGDEYVKLASGHTANLGAEAISVAVLPLLVLPTNNGAYGQLFFDSLCYNALPRVLAIDSIGSRADGNDTLLVVNRIGGNFATGAATIGSLFGLLFDDAESVFSFSIASGNCQVRGSIGNSFPRTTPRVESILPAGRTGWAKIWSAADAGLVGAVLNRNSNIATSSSAFAGGHNLHKLSLTPNVTITVPIFPPSC